MTKNEFEIYLNDQYKGICIDSMPLELMHYFPKSAYGHHKYADMGTRIRRRDKTLFKALYDEYRFANTIFVKATKDYVPENVNFKLEAIWNPLKKK